MDEVDSHDSLSNIVERSPHKALCYQALLRFSAQTLDFSLLPPIPLPVCSTMTGPLYEAFKELLFTLAVR